MFERCEELVVENADLEKQLGDPTLHADPKLARKVGKRISLRIQLGSFDAVCRMVAAGVGLAIMPMTCAQRFAQPLGLKLVPLEDAWARREIRLVKRAGRDLPQFGELLIRYLVDATAAEVKQA